VDTRPAPDAAASHAPRRPNGAHFVVPAAASSGSIASANI